MSNVVQNITKVRTAAIANPSYVDRANHLVESTTSSCAVERDRRSFLRIRGSSVDAHQSEIHAKSGTYQKRKHFQ